ncbi:ABC transporter permease [Meridianimarinicoccus aquatilis]|uniref:ABC transporter permease n=1 Tax=Meridianimarinicoccus aquatilis TaxID=2552766 RepID=A0A4R6AMM4_9RHOB|nr:FtsX-like permease family protein [Fluviibacterium aquatile]TDL83788.1 ABC transporter permease [Fluviibacterium aquatile]
MMDVWDGLSALTQDIVLIVALGLPALILCRLVLRGFAPWPLIGALLWRFRWANALFVLLIAISVGMGLGLLAQERGLREGTARAADKFDLVVTAPGSEITMMLATVYLQPSDVPLLDGATYQAIAGHENVAIAAPLAFGDSYGASSVVGTTAEFVQHLSDGEIEGRLWKSTAEAVIGALTPLQIGDVFEPAHGVGDAAENDAHAADLTVVGRIGYTGTPWDRAVLVPIETIWEVHGLANGHAPERADQIGPPFDPDYFPGTPAIVVRASAMWANYALRSEFTRDAQTMAFFPGAVLSNLYRVMGDIRQAMSLMSLVTQCLVAASVLLGLFILSRLFMRQMALLRALGAPARFVFAVLWSYCTALLVAGSVLGLGLGWITAMILSRIISARTDILISAQIGWTEFHYLAGFVSLMTLLSLLPALAVLRKPIVDGLRG